MTRSAKAMSAFIFGRSAQGAGHDARCFASTRAPAPRTTDLRVVPSLRLAAPAAAVPRVGLIEQFSSTRAGRGTPAATTEGANH